MKFFFLSFFLFIFLLSSVFAVGVSPPSFRVDYKEGINYEFDVRVINNGIPDGFISTTLFGDMAEHFTVSEPEFQFNPKEKLHMITISGTLPDYNDLTLFGGQRLLFYVDEGKLDGTGGVSFSTSIKGVIVIDIPVPGKFGIIDSFEVKNTNEGFIAPFSLALKNRGADDLKRASAQIIISDFEGNKLDTLNYNNIDIDFDKTYIIDDVLPTSTYDSSKYFVKALFTYDPIKAAQSKETSFFVGSTDVSLMDYTANVTSGKINKINFELQSLWGSPLKNIRASLQSGEISQSLPVLDFNPFEKKVLEAYLDVPVTNATSISVNLLLEIPVDATNTAHKSFPLTFDVIQEVDPSFEFPISSSTLMFVGVIIIVLFLIGINIAMFLKRKK